MTARACGVLAAGFACSALLSGSPAQAQAVSWSGPYVGINVGGGWGSSSQRDTLLTPPPPPPPPPIGFADGDYRVGGAMIGGGAGYNYVRDWFLIGLEADIDWSSISGSSALCGGTHECGTKLNWVSTVRGRVGALVAPASAVYVTGGLAIGEVHAYDVTAPGYSGTMTRTGWTIGAGIEHRFGGAWSAKLEYLYMNFGGADYFSLPGATPEHVDLDVHAIRVGLNYAFK